MENGESKVERRNVLLEKSDEFALNIVNFSFQLQQEKELVISKQLLRSRTAIGALLEEAQQAESKADFIPILSTANKEAKETHYWLRSIRDSAPGISDTNSFSLISESEELKRLIISIIKSAKARK